MGESAVWHGMIAIRLPCRRGRAFARGDRFDEAVPGSGLGLSIVREIVGLYGGAADLGVSELGGLKVELELPAAEA